MADKYIGEEKSSEQNTKQMKENAMLREIVEWLSLNRNLVKIVHAFIKEML